MARAKKPPITERQNQGDSVNLFEVEFATARQKLPAEYEKAITGAGRTLGSRLKQLNTLKGRLEKAIERLAKAREQKKFKATAAVQARFEKAQAAVAEIKADSADLREEISELRKSIADLKKRSRQFQAIEKAIQKIEKKAAKPRKYRRKKKLKTSPSASEWEKFAGGEAVPSASSARKESTFFNQQAETEIE